MRISVFLSYPQPFRHRQQEFIDEVSSYLRERGYEPRTLGVTDYDVNEPLAAVRRLMLESNGILCVAFRRTLIEDGECKPENEIDDSGYKISHRWITSSWCHVEVAMAYQLGLPILILRQTGVVPEGMLERGVTGTYLPAFDLDVPLKEYFESEQWKQIVGKWEGYVRGVVEYKGKPPKMY